MNQEQVWDEISKVWKGYRCRPVDEVVDFLRNKKGKILDLCCGAGRNFIKIEGNFYDVMNLFLSIKRSDVCNLITCNDISLQLEE